MNGFAEAAEIFDPKQGNWSVTGALWSARDSHTATTLPSGKVLVAGGENGSALASAELYDVPKRTWSVTSPLVTGRYFHTATLLQSGRVLVTGGLGVNGAYLNSAELY